MKANKDNLISIACYTNDGRLVAAAPVATEKNNLDIVDQGMVYGGDGTDGERAFFHTACTEFV